MWLSLLEFQLPYQKEIFLEKKKLYAWYTYRDYQYTVVCAFYIERFYFFDTENIPPANWFYCDQTSFKVVVLKT